MFWPSLISHHENSFLAVYFYLLKRKSRLKPATIAREISFLPGGKGFLHIQNCLLAQCFYRMNAGNFVRGKLGVVAREDLFGKLPKRTSWQPYTPPKSSARSEILACALLPILDDCSRRKFVDLNLRAHFLDLGGLLFHRCRKTCNSAFQLLDFLVLFEELVE